MADFVYECTLSMEALGIATSELNENPDTRILELKAFRDRLLQTPGLRTKTDPVFLLRFLRARKFDQERAYELILNFYRSRKESPEVSLGLTPSAIPHILQLTPPFSVPYPYKDREGRPVDFIFPVEMDEDSMVHGRTQVIDYKDLRAANMINHYTACSKISIMKLNYFPVRQKHVLLLNESRFVDVLLKFFKILLTEKIFSRIVCIGTNWSKLHDYIDPAVLPPEYGGTLVSEIMEDMRERWNAELLRSAPSFEEDFKYGFVNYTIGQDTSRDQEDAISDMAGIYRKVSED